MKFNPEIIVEEIYKFGAADFWLQILEKISVFIGTIRPFSTVISLLFLTGIIYCFLRIEQIESATKHHDISPEEKEKREKEMSNEIEAKVETVGTRFERAIKHLDTGKESEWRLAILEADILLDEMVTAMGYRGDSLGDKLKGIEESDFLTLGKAWEAHSVRNKIAHEGSSFVLTEREARRIIALYEEVFREFRYI